MPDDTCSPARLTACGCAARASTAAAASQSAVVIAAGALICVILLGGAVAFRLVVDIEDQVGRAPHCGQRPAAHLTHSGVAPRRNTRFCAGLWASPTRCSRCARVECGARARVPHSAAVRCVPVLCRNSATCRARGLKTSSAPSTRQAMRTLLVSARASDAVTHMPRLHSEAYVRPLAHARGPSRRHGTHRRAGG